MRWLERLRTLEKNSDFSAGELQNRKKVLLAVFTVPRPSVKFRGRLDRRICPVDWTAGVARLRAMGCPAGIRPDRCRQVIIDAGRFLDQWGAGGGARLDHA